MGETGLGCGAIIGMIIGGAVLVIVIGFLLHVGWSAYHPMPYYPT